VFNIHNIQQHHQDSDSIYQTLRQPGVDPKPATLHSDHWEVQDLNDLEDLGPCFLSHVTLVAWMGREKGGPFEQAFKNAPKWPANFGFNPLHHTAGATRVNIQGVVNEWFFWLSPASFGKSEDGQIPLYQQKVHDYVIKCADFVYGIWKTNRENTEDQIHAIKQKFSTMPPDEAAKSEFTYQGLQGGREWGFLLLPFEHKVLEHINQCRGLKGEPPITGRFPLTQHLSLMGPPLAKGQGTHTDVLWPGSTICCFQYRSAMQFMQWCLSTSTSSSASADPPLVSSLAHLQSAEVSDEDVHKFLAGEGAGFPAGVNATVPIHQPGTRVYRPTDECLRMMQQANYTTYEQALQMVQNMLESYHYTVCFPLWPHNYAEEVAASCTDQHVASMFEAMWLPLFGKMDAVQVDQQTKYTAGKSHEHTAIMLQTMFGLWQPFCFRTMVGNMSTMVGNMSTMVGNMSTMVGNMSTMVGNMSTMVRNMSTMVGNMLTTVDMPTMVGKNAMLETCQPWLEKCQPWLETYPQWFAFWAFHSELRSLYS
jgi:hypothetical protein